jgi:hypothetical protein
MVGLTSLRTNNPPRLPNLNRRRGIVPSAAGGMVTDPNGDPGGIAAILHPNEMVLPAPISQHVQEAAQKASAGGSGHKIIHLTKGLRYLTLSRMNGHTCWIPLLRGKMK